MATARRKSANTTVEINLDRARVFMSAEPAITREESVEVDDGEGGKKSETATVTVRDADVAIVIQVTDGDEPAREWLSTTTRLTAAERAELGRLFRKLATDVASTEYEAI